MKRTSIRRQLSSVNFQNNKKPLYINIYLYYYYPHNTHII
nr:MAG TPA: hypothetical protein [Bacteriophage sp.]